MPQGRKRRWLCAVRGARCAVRPPGLPVRRFRLFRAVRDFRGWLVGWCEAGQGGVIEVDRFGPQVVVTLSDGRVLTPQNRDLDAVGPDYVVVSGEFMRLETEASERAGAAKRAAQPQMLQDGSRVWTHPGNVGPPTPRLNLPKGPVPGRV